MKNDFIIITDPVARLRMLEDNADTVENREYSKRLTKEELAIAGQEFLENDIRIVELKERKAALIKEISAELKEAGQEAARLRDALWKKVVWKKGRLFGVKDMESGRMDFYAEDGTHIESRYLLPEEKIYPMFHESAPARTGTGG